MTAAWTKLRKLFFSVLSLQESSQIYAHQVVSSMHIYVLHCFAVCCCSQAHPHMKSTKTGGLCLLCVTVCVSASEPFSHCESCSTVLSVSTIPAERQPSVHTLSDCRVILKREKLGEREEGGRNIERACGKCKDRGEKSKRLSDGGVEFDSERERKKRGESMVAKERFQCFKGFPYHSLWHITYTAHYRLDPDSYTNWLKEVSWARPLIRCVCVLSAGERKERDFVHLSIPGHLSIYVCMWVKKGTFLLQIMVEWNKST